MLEFKMIVLEVTTNLLTSFYVHQELEWIRLVLNDESTIFHALFFFSGQCMMLKKSIY